MRTIRKRLLQISPHLLFTLAFSLCYAMLAYSFMAEGESLSMLAHYLRGLALMIPFAVFACLVKKSAKIWQFALGGIVIIAGLHLAFGDGLFTTIAIIIYLLRGGNRVRQQLQILEEELPEESLLDHPSMFLLCFPVLCFLVAGNQYLPFFQELALYHFIAMCLLFFVRGGLLRFEQYVKLSELSANVPSARILETGTRIFVVAALVCTLVLVPILRSSYQFTPIVFDLSAATEWEEEAEETTDEGTDYVAEIYASIEESEPAIDLSWLWAIIDKLLLAAFCAVMAWFIYHCLRVLIVNFNKTQVEKNDVIESTFLDSEAQLAFARSKARFSALFDFSEAMKIRRRYKKEFKKHAPKPWQTPTELEAMANKDLPELHAAYEAARYGK